MCSTPKVQGVHRKQVWRWTKPDLIESSKKWWRTLSEPHQLYPAHFTNHLLRSEHQQILGCFKRANGLKGWLLQLTLHEGQFPPDCFRNDTCSHDRGETQATRTGWTWSGTPISQCRDDEKSNIGPKDEHRKENRPRTAKTQHQYCQANMATIRKA